MRSNKIIASISKNAQTGPDTYETWTESMICTQETKILEIINWYYFHKKNAKRIINIELTEVQEVDNV